MNPMLTLDFIPVQGGISVSQTCYAITSYDDVLDLEIFKIYISDNYGGGIKDADSGVLYRHIAVDENGIPYIFDAYKQKVISKLSFVSCSVEGKPYQR
ncbi:TPA: hypothetical protein ACXRZ0_001787 [Klebsiella pneumoniae]|uniref:hypothetical protein n=1 Tax=Klebsiella pneumoniae TaxID=573 RepID=UPI0028B46E5A|nr:hypothetical protein [Klebsiella pneumoniae]HDZ2451658.1 hypothetical protein [Klebsiella pneumoniae]